MLPWVSPGRTVFPPFPASGGCSCSLACGPITPVPPWPVSPCLWSHCLFLSMCHSPSYKQLGVAFRAQLDCPRSSLHLKSKLHRVCQIPSDGHRVRGLGRGCLWGPSCGDRRLLIHSPLRQISVGHPRYARLCSGQREA